MIILMVLVVLVVGSISGSFALSSSDEVKVYLDEEQIEFDIKPEIVNGRTMVPVSAIFQAFEMTVTWNNELRKDTYILWVLNVK